MNHPRLRLAALVGGLALMAAGGRLALAGPSAAPPELAAPPSAASVAEGVGAPATLAPDADLPAAADAAEAEEGSSSAAHAGHQAAAPLAVAPGPPSRLLMPQQDLEAPVTAVGVQQSGVLQLPDDPDVVGWWAAGALPGDAQGTVVVAGHLDDVDAGVGALAALHTAGVGDRVELADGTGGMIAYTVESRRSYPKAALPPQLFVRDGPPRLALITCGGAFDERRGHYADNVVVLAVPA